jgi:hypothetical protein
MKQITINALVDIGCLITFHRRQVNFETRLPPAALMTAVR